MILETKRAKYVFLPELGVLLNQEISDEYKHLLPAPLDENKLIANLEREMSDEELERRFCSISNITLNISDDCNFRCKYCSYSGIYEITRTHSPKKMSFTTARKAVDYLITLIKNKKRKTKMNGVNIGFYGGEPLTEFQLVKDIMIYAKKRFLEKDLVNKFALDFRLGTNGYLLKYHIADFLVEWDVTLDVSLDGPAEEHDKFRVTRNGRKTWDVITQNLLTLQEKYPDFYKDKVNFLTTLHPRHDYKRIDDFYFQNKTHFDPGKNRTNLVNQLLLKDEFKDNISNVPGQLSRLNLIQMVERLDDRLTLKNLDNNSYFTQMCFPGEAKPFVDSDGRLHICERVRPGIPIGDVDNGFDYDKIRALHRQWVAEIIRLRCWECPVWAFCGVCAAQSLEEHHLRVECTYKDQGRRMLQSYLEYKEEEEFKNQQDQQFDNVMDYVGQL